MSNAGSWFDFLSACGVMGLDPFFIWFGSRALDSLSVHSHFAALEDLRAATPDIESDAICPSVLLVGRNPLHSDPGLPLIGLVGTLEGCSRWDWRPVYMQRCMACDAITLTDLRKGHRCKCGSARFGFAHGVEEMLGNK